MKGFACTDCAELEGQVCHGCNGCACVKGPGGRKSCNIHKAAYESDPLEDPLWTRGGDGVGCKLCNETRTRNKRQQQNNADGSAAKRVALSTLGLGTKLVAAAAAPPSFFSFTRFHAEFWATLWVYYADVWTNKDGKPTIPIALTDDYRKNPAGKWRQRYDNLIASNKLTVGDQTKLDWQLLQRAIMHMCKHQKWLITEYRDPTSKKLKIRWGDVLRAAEQDRYK
eukprot:g4204.t1